MGVDNVFKPQAAVIGNKYVFKWMELIEVVWCLWRDCREVTRLEIWVCLIWFQLDIDLACERRNPSEWKRFFTRFYEITKSNVMESLMTDGVVTLMEMQARTISLIKYRAEVLLLLPWHDANYNGVLNLSQSYKWWVVVSVVTIATASASIPFEIFG